MKFRGCSSEIYLTKKYVMQEEWLNFIQILSKYNGYLRKWEITVSFEGNKVRYFVNTKCKLPPTINNLDSFLLKNIEEMVMTKETYFTLPMFLPIGSSLVDVYNYLEIKNIGKLKYVNIVFRKITEEKILSHVNIYVEREEKLFKSNMILGLPANVLSVDFSGNKRFSYKSVPKYLDISKALHMLKTDSSNSLFQVDTFPYLGSSFYMAERSYDFAKHSLVLGSSGCGKSKFLSLFIDNIKKNNTGNYKVVMIDPHAAMEGEIGGLGKTIDFKSLEDSIDLFASISNDLVASTELALELFKSLISDQYNSKLERVLRHAIYLLLAGKSFNFVNLKKIILDVEYRNDFVRKMRNDVPVSVLYFFLNDFNDLKTKSYGEAISPIIAFIDEMEMLPVFNEEKVSQDLKSQLKKII